MVNHGQGKYCGCSCSWPTDNLLINAQQVIQRVFRRWPRWEERQVVNILASRKASNSLTILYSQNTVQTGQRRYSQSSNRFQLQSLELSYQKPLQLNINHCMMIPDLPDKD